MGLRGPLPMDSEARAARGGRDRAKGFHNDATTKAWAARATKFEQQGNKLIDKAVKRPVTKTRNNGPQVNPEFRMGLQLLKLADQLWSRLGRVGAPPDGKPSKPDPTTPRSLAEYRRRA